VAIKALRVDKNDDMHEVKRVAPYVVVVHDEYHPLVKDLKKRIDKEVTMWKRLSHPNIVSFLGVTDTPAPLPMVSEWMPSGDIRHYVKNHPNVDRLQLVFHNHIRYRAGKRQSPGPRRGRYSQKQEHATNVKFCR